MKLLREYIREALLSEAAKGVNDLGDRHYVRVIKDGDYTAEFSVRATPETPGDFDEIFGNLLIVKKHGAGDCLGAWMVASSGARNKWGPLLYDMAMEYATNFGGGLMADRVSVSPDAYGVWDYYMSNRSDVEVEQLDMPQDWFENGPQDDCKQGSTWKWLARNDGDEEEWTKVPLSKIYKKQGMKTIEALRSAGKLKEVEL